MRNRPEEKKQLEQLDALTGRSPRKLFSLSPNDVLVQISLPLVLILAIATRLMMIGQSMASMDRGPVILDLWKQQLILRVEHVLKNWEKESGLSAFPDFERIRWNKQWPVDPDFQRLCSCGLDLADIEKMKLSLYRKALHYRPPASDSEQTQFAFLQDLYDPLEGDPPADADKIPSEFRINAQRREYALGYIEERCLKWKSRIENMQWGIIDQVVARLPREENLTDKRLSVQMKNISTALAEKGYPLLPAVANEYGDNE